MGNGRPTFDRSDPRIQSDGRHFFLHDRATHGLFVVEAHEMKRTVDCQKGKLVLEGQPSQLGLATRIGNRDSHVAEELRPTSGVGGNRGRKGKHIGALVDVPKLAVQLSKAVLVRQQHAHLRRPLAMPSKQCEKPPSQESGGLSPANIGYDLDLVTTGRLHVRWESFDQRAPFKPRMRREFEGRRRLGAPGK